MNTFKEYCILKENQEISPWRLANVIISSLPGAKIKDGHAVFPKKIFSDQEVLGKELDPIMMKMGFSRRPSRINVPSWESSVSMQDYQLLQYYGTNNVRLPIWVLIQTQKGSF